MDRIEAIVDEILDAEGGLVFTDRANDRGGPTFAGITLQTLTEWRRARRHPDEAVHPDSLTARDVRNLTEREVRAIYRERYILAPNFDDIEDPLLRHNAIDAGVLHGTGWSARRLQEVGAVKVDGIIGPLSLAAINRHTDSPAMNIRFAVRRVEKVVRIARADPTQIRWLAGWTNRALRFLLDEADLLDAP